MSERIAHKFHILNLFILVALLAVAAPAWAVEFLVNERNESTIYVWDPDAATETVYHTLQNNDADINVPEGSQNGWYVEHFNDEFGDFTPGSGSGANNAYNFPPNYPKHVTVFDGAVFVMSRNDATIYKYDLDGNELDTLSTGNNVGQGMATDGTLLYVSFWDGSDSFFETFDSDLNPVGSFSNPTGLPQGHNNVVDIAYDPATDTFYGLSTQNEQGTSTNTQDIVEFSMGGSVVETFSISFSSDGIGQFVIDGAEAEPRATFGVQKVYVDLNPEPVEVTLSCNTGLPLQQTVPLEPDRTGGEYIEFVVKDFASGELDCEITESVPGGYDVIYVGFEEGQVTESEESCVFENVEHGDFADTSSGIENVDNFCLVVNIPQESEVTVTKEWIDENPQFNAPNFARATWFCSNIPEFIGTATLPLLGQVAVPDSLEGGSGDTDSGNLTFIGGSGEGSAEDSFTTFGNWDGGTVCDVTEQVVEGGVVVDDSDCQNIVIGPGEDASCTIVNTRLYEGIPTLSQYGLGLLALLMLGMGFVAFRRFV